MYIRVYGQVWRADLNIISYIIFVLWKQVSLYMFYIELHEFHTSNTAENIDFCSKSIRTCRLHAVIITVSRYVVQTGICIVIHKNNRTYYS